MLENTKEVITVCCSDCGAVIHINTYRDRYIKDLISYSKRAHSALRTIIENNKASPSLKIYYPNGQYDTLGNIRAEAPHKF